MAEVRNADARRLLDVIGDVEESADLDDFAERSVRALADLVPVNHVAYSELDLLDPGLVRYARSDEEPESKWTDEVDETFWTFLHQHPLRGDRRKLAERRSITISDFLSPNDFHRLELYEGYYRAIGCEHELRLGFPTPPWRDSSLFFGRDGASHDFTQRERAMLDLLLPHLHCAKRIAADRQLLVDTTRALESLSVEVIPLTTTGKAEWVGPRARAWLTRYFDGPRVQSGRLPEELVRWMKAFRTPSAPRRPVQPLVVTEDGKTLVVSLVQALGPSAPDLLVLRQQDRQEPAMANEAARLLTNREREILELVARGLTNEEIGRAAYIAPSTVRKHLENVFQKLEVRSRTAAVARAFSGRLDHAAPRSAE